MAKRKYKLILDVEVTDKGGCNNCLFNSDSGYCEIEHFFGECPLSTGENFKLIKAEYIDTPS